MKDPQRTIKPIAVGRTICKSETGQHLLYIDVQLESGEWVTWVIPEMSCRIIDNETYEQAKIDGAKELTDAIFRKMRPS